jgi:integrase
LKLGRTDELTAEQARDEARRLIAELALGGDPAADRKRAREAERQRRLAPTVADLLAAWTADRRRSWRPTSEQEIARQVLHIRRRLGARKAGGVGQQVLRDLHAEISRTAPVMANRVLSTIGSAYSWALSRPAEWPSITANPTTGIAMNREDRRERYPVNGELQRLVTALHERQDLAAKFYLFLLLTGARRGEVETMRWSDVDLAAGVWTKPATATKQKRSHRLPLSPEAIVLLRQVQIEQPFMPFAKLDEWTLRKAWREILAEAKISDLHVHDLRHWHASLLASMGLSLPIIGALLGHSSPSTTARYAHLLDEALKQATNKLGELVRLPAKREG